MAEVLETIRGALVNGLRSDSRDVRSGDNCQIMTALRPTPFGARVHETVTQPIAASELTTHSITIAHPFPQLFIGKGVTLLVTEDKLWTVNMTNWTLTAVSMFDPAIPANSATITSGGGPWHFMDFGTTWMLFNGASVVFKSGWIDSTKTFVDEAITATTGCPFRGQGIMGGFDPTDYWPTAWVDYWNSIPHSSAADSDWNLVPPSPGANWVSWSSIGGGDLLMNRIAPATFNTSLSTQILANGNFLNGSTDWTLSDTDWAIANGIATHTLPAAAGVDTMTQAGANMLIALATGGYWVEFDTVFTTTNGDGFKVTLGNVTSAVFTSDGHYRTKLTVASGTDFVVTPQQATATPSVVPISDIDSNGSWTFTPASPATFWDKLDAPQADTSKVNVTITADAWFRVKVGPTTVGSSAVVTKLNVIVWCAVTFGDDDIIVDLYNGSDLATSLGSYTIAATVGGAEETYPNATDHGITSFTQAEIDSITDWTNIVVKVADHLTTASSIEVREIRLEATVITADTFTMDNITVTKDLAEEETMALHYARRNEAGAMPMDFQGTVIKTLPLRNRCMVYGADGISAIIPSSQPFPTFGLQEGVHRLGIASRDAVGGHLDEHVFLDTSGILYKVDGDGQTERLGFEEFFVPMLGQQFTINYDPDRDGYYITGDDNTPNVDCYYLTSENKLSKHHQLVSSIFHRDGGLIGIVEDDATPTTLAWKSNITDLGYDEIKYLSWVEVSYSNITSLSVNVFYRHTKADAFTAFGAVTSGSPDGRFYIGVSGVEFQIELAGTTAAGAEIERIDFRYDTHDNRTARSPRRKPAYFS